MQQLEMPPKQENLTENPMVSEIHTKQSINEGKN
jgi:hypothetical protein